MARAASGIIFIKDIEKVREGMRLARLLKSLDIDIARVKKALKLLKMTERFVRSGGRFKRTYTRKTKAKQAPAAKAAVKK